MLDSLNSESIGKFRLHVEPVERTRFFDQRHFSLSLLDEHANKIHVFRGLYNAGRPSIHVPAWIDGEFIENATPTPSFSLPGRGRTLTEQVAEKIGAIIPPGGRLWLAYESFGAEGALMRETRAGLLAQIPLIATPIGFLLFRADCWLGMRDWHFPEGGREGPRKLQGNKPLDVAHARMRAAEIAAELKKYLQTDARNEIATQAQARAKIILSLLKTWKVS